MRNTHRCPKCTHHRVIFLPSITDRSPGAMATSFLESPRPTVQALPLAVLVEPEVRTPTGRGLRYGQFEAYICEACGYCELYVKDAAEIPLAKIPGAKILESKDPPPFR
jgi:predicted nucleic-acid-binding Zn-ribbon protein